MKSKDIQKLKDLRDLCISDDLLDLDSYDSISRAKKIQNAWEALKVIDALELLPIPNEGEKEMKGGTYE